jgi:polar amino acid transport system substrate-binding protein
MPFLPSSCKLSKIYYLLTCLLFVLAFQSQSYSQSIGELNYTTEEYPPYSFTEGSNVTGISVDLLNLILIKMGSEKQNIRVLPWARALIELENSSNNVLFPMAKTPERNAKFNLACGEPMSSDYAYIAMKKNKIIINTLQDLKKYTIGTVRGDIGEELLITSLGNNKNIVSNSSMEYILKMLVKNRVQLAFYHKNVLNIMLKRWGYNADIFEIVYKTPVMQSCYAFSKAVDPMLVQKFEFKLREVLRTGEYKLLKKKYGL